MKMNSFEYCIPTRIIFGADTVSGIGELVKGFGKKVLLISYSKASLEKYGIYDTVLTSLGASGVDVVEFYGVKPNPVISHVREGVNLSKKEKVDVVLAIGGGSVIDEAKVIAAGALSEADPWDFFEGKAEVNSALPILTILTIPATSSEMNSGAVISNEEKQRKDGFFSPFFFPKISVLDPTVTYTIPLKQTAYSAADIISHLLEGYLTHRDDWAPFQDGLIELMIRTVIDSTERIIKDQKDFHARASMMWVGSFAWSGFPVAGVGPIGFPIHMFGHTLSALYDLPHGAAMSVIIPGWMEYDCGLDNKKYIQFAKNVFGITADTEQAAAKAGIEALRDWFVRIGTPTTFKAAGIPTDELDKMADNAMVTAQAWGMGDWYTKEKIIEIYSMTIG
jgi:alcohol dehydrogenase YqhD (iron-dependent ADH family)